MDDDGEDSDSVDEEDTDEDDDGDDGDSGDDDQSNDDWRITMKMVIRMVILKRDKKVTVGMERLREATMITGMMSTTKTKLIRVCLNYHAKLW